LTERLIEGRIYSQIMFNKLVVGVVFLTCYMLSAAFSTAYSKKIQSQETIGKDIMTFFLNNHLSYIMTCVMIWMALFYNNLYLMYMNSLTFKDPVKEYVDFKDIKQMVDRTTFAYTIFNITLLVILVQGVLLAFVRTNEPVYRFIMKRELKCWFGILHAPKMDKNDITQKPAVELMNAQNSIELVHIILHSIANHTAGVSKTS
jgi:hypothetical protein